MPSACNSVVEAVPAASLAWRSGYWMGTILDFDGELVLIFRLARTGS